MYKKTIIAIFLTLGTLSQASNDVNHSAPLDIKTFVNNIIDSIEKKENPYMKGWSVKKRKSKDNKESFIMTFKGTSANDKDLLGLGFLHDIHYAKNHFDATSTLASFPNIAYTDQRSRQLIAKLIRNKTFTLNSSYDLDTFNYRISLKDINLYVPSFLSIRTKDILSNGYYDQNNVKKQKATFSIRQMEIKSLKPGHSGESIKIKRFHLKTGVKTQDKTVALTYAISLEKLATNLRKDHTKIENLNLSLTIGNLNLASYKKITTFIKKNPKNLDQHEKLQLLAMEALSKSENIYIEINDISLEKLLLKGKELGPFRITSKVSLKNTKNLLQMFMVAPDKALKSLSAKLSLEFPRSFLEDIYKEDPSVGALAALFAKYKNDSIVYDALLKDGKLTINDQPFSISDLLPTIPKKHTIQQEKVVTPIPPKTQSIHSVKYAQNELHQAVISKNVNEIKKLLTQTHDINQVDKLGRTALHYAAYNGDIASAKLLLDDGANINITDASKQWTALFFAVFMKHPLMVDFLIEKGADQSIKDKLGRTIKAYK